MYEKMKRYGQVIGVRPEDFERYKKYHAAVWPEVLDMIGKCNIRNYSIFHKDNMLYAYFEYTGDDFAADMARMAADPKTQVATRRAGEWWAEMEEVFHLD
jgi:L-rhamnose mutarotase